MKRAILIDGNNLLFRSYYATAYNGNLMKNSKNFPTNALYGFINMINKILIEEKPEYIMVAFDKGKSFRHEKYKDYKAGRIETPNDLLIQFPKAYELLDALGITAISIEDYEADDIIGTFAKMADLDECYDATIISSDKDLLQLISHDVNVKLLKQKDFILMNETTFNKTYGIDPIRIIDLKALMGDPSDNIPGVKGIGEKTALALLKEYKTLEEIYNSIDTIKGKLKEKLIADKENAFFSKELATIYKSVPLNMTFDSIKIKPKNSALLHKLYEDLEFFSLIKKEKDKEVEEQISLFSKEATTEEIEKSNIMQIKEENISEDIKMVNPEDLDYELISEKIDLSNNFAFYIEMDNENYHFANIIGMSAYDGNKLYYFTEKGIIENKDIFKNKTSTYDLKKAIVALNKLGIKINTCSFDTMIATYLLNYNIKEDISYIARTKGYNIEFYDILLKKEHLINNELFIKNICLKSKFIYETKNCYLKELEKDNMSNLFNEIEMPLVNVLAKMEMTGIRVSPEILEEMKRELIAKLGVLSKEIFDHAGIEFNISSPKQLGEILFEKLDLPHGKKKGRNGYKTDHDTLMKYYDMHPIIPLILEHRRLNKLLNTYMDSLNKFVMEDGKIHTIFKQTITRTGRLSSAEPNLQNIPIRNEEGKQIRKAFLPEVGHIILTSDYSQIELRILAHISKCDALINAFNHHEDIHTKVASDIYDVPTSEVTKNMRRTAKAVIFGIVYGISGFGLGENLYINPKEAKKFIEKYLTMYPGVKKYMDNIIEQAKQNGYVRTIMNRKREIDELKNTNYIIRKSGERMALNTPIQGSSADIIKKAMIEVDKEITSLGLKSKLILQVHDELVFTVPKNEKEIMEKVVTNIMENTYKLLVPLKVEVDTGVDWYNVK